MKKTIFNCLILVIFLFNFAISFAQMPYEAQPVPVMSCGCPSDVSSQDCVATYEEWLLNRNMDFWVKEPEVIAIGQNGERAKQLVWWVLNHRALDDNKTILDVWSLSRNISYFLLIIATVLIGVGVIVGQKNNFNLKINISDKLLKVALLLLYITFSATFVLFLIQLSDILMQFFIRTLGADKIFNIFFSADNAGGQQYLTSSEGGYKEIAKKGCSNISYAAAESVRFSKLILIITNISYFAIGILLLARKIVLWFLLIVSPFLAILIPLKIVKNVGVRWMTLFFQWLFYGPLFGLFLGGVAMMWNSKNSIPFQFNFERIGQTGSNIFPTAISITYNGPSKAMVSNISSLISSNYIDTFAEYLIALMMLWIAIILPWFLMRGFRDYCCDGIYAIKNILMANLDALKSGGGLPQNPFSPAKLKAKMEMEMPKNNNISMKLNMDNIEDIKRAKTEDLNRSMQLSAGRISDIAKMEISKDLKESMNKNIDYLRNPMNAQTPTERQQFMNIRSELFERATKGDDNARRTLAAISNSRTEQSLQKQNIIATISNAKPIVVVTAIKVGLPKEKVMATFNSIYYWMATKDTVINTLSAASNLQASQTKAILNSVGKTENLSESATKLIKNVAAETGIEDAKIKELLEKMLVYFKENNDLIKEIASKESLSDEEVKKILMAYLPNLIDPNKHIEDSISLPQNVSIEEYEQIKNMWIDHYEKGEIPTTDTISTRKEWVESDMVNITNILNKLMSPDASLKVKAIDEVSYILPVFLINNLKGDELMIYLKAKLEAAKQVIKDFDKKADIFDKMSQENLVEVAAPQQKAEEKTMTLEMETPQSEKTTENTTENTTQDVKQN